ncbi:DUF4176 domain-containing protein [Enterococcus wangshanyuanii]|uniref:Type II secretion protein n=1 Tax=Enterococcus wangshanyuanii TaxID=2005703 RepID=A0ABQ1NI56_9ENTE|nr:DUF4176 domain-containing protein [Enterococcus wangshanyuanii]GGC77820.1 type II secretion protein [Enterococcus wangshanyuanii]
MLPIGSIVYLKEGSQKIMILNRGPVVNEKDRNVLYDYSGCQYPNGLNPNEVLYFNQENIDTILFNGYKDEDETRFEHLYNEWLNGEGKLIEKGIVSKSLG